MLRSILNELKEHLSKNKAPYILAALVSLLTPLFLVIWSGWLFPLLAQRGEAIPRRVLGALIGVLLIFLLASVSLTAYYALELKALRKQSTASKTGITDTAIDEMELQFLKAISAHDKLTDEQVAGMFKLNLQRARYHLQKLCDIGYLRQVTPIILTGDPWPYYLAQEGRKFLVTKGLL